MRIRFKVRNEKSEWWEETVVDLPRNSHTPRKDAKRYIRGVVDRFNASLRPGEIPYELLKVRIKDLNETTGKHDWGKVNLVTIMDKHGSYDRYECRRCGAKGKRFGLGEYIKPDRANQERCKVKP